MMKNKKNVLLILLAFLILGLLYMIKYPSGDGKTGSEVMGETAGNAPSETQSFETGFFSPESETKETTIIVYVSGAVANPGVYRLNSNSRIYEVLSLAGGLTDEADLNSLNQADFLSDGMHIIVPKEGEDISSYLSTGESDGTVNINTADLKTLTTLPGIGESKAQNIIEYRKTNGYFKNTEDIMNVTGIGEALYSQIRNRIKV